MFPIFRTLLYKHDIEGTIGSGRWAGAAKAEREKVLDAIYVPFCRKCRRKDGVTKEQVLKKKLHKVAFFKYV